MRLEEISKEIISVIVLIFILIAFIPIFQELGVNYKFMELFIFAAIIMVFITLGIWVKQRFSD